MVTIYAPASIGNVSVGFDVLGMAISPIDGTPLGDVVTVRAASGFRLQCEGRFASSLPHNPQNNIVYQCWQRFCEALGETVPVVMTLEKNMPVGSGLGSSACSVVAALVAMNVFCHQPFNHRQLLLLMGEMEGRISGSVHYDNVAPCFYGGLQLLPDEQEALCQSIPCFENWLWVMAYPGTQLSTAGARSILPAHYSRETCIRHARGLAGFIHACHTRQSSLAAALMNDVIAEPWRSRLLPDFERARGCIREIGALNVGISGSGPTLFAVCDNEDTAQKVAAWLKNNWVQASSGFVHLCRTDTAGARQTG